MGRHREQDARQEEHDRADRDRGQHRDRQRPDLHRRAATVGRDLGDPAEAGGRNQQSAGDRPARAVDERHPDERRADRGEERPGTGAGWAGRDRVADGGAAGRDRDPVDRPGRQEDQRRDRCHRAQPGEQPQAGVVAPDEAVDDRGGEAEQRQGQGDLRGFGDHHVTT